MNVRQSGLSRTRVTHTTQYAIRRVVRGQPVLECFAFQEPFTGPRSKCIGHIAMSYLGRQGRQEFPQLTLPLD
jgi:hypothetical protein